MSDETLLSPVSKLSARLLADVLCVVLARRDHDNYILANQIRESLGNRTFNLVESLEIILVSEEIARKIINRQPEGEKAND